VYYCGDPDVVARFARSVDDLVAADSVERLGGGCVGDVAEGQSVSRIGLDSDGALFVRTDDEGGLPADLMFCRAADVVFWPHGFVTWVPAVVVRFALGEPSSKIGVLGVPVRWPVDSAEPIDVILPGGDP